MAQQPSFEGVIPILATPFDEHEALDPESLDRLVRFMVRLGVDGITILGVLGEANRLLDQEREEVIRVAVRAAEGKVPVVVGTSHTGTGAAVALSQMAQDLGASAVMVTPAAEAVPSDERIFEYYSRISEAIHIALVVQDHPASTGVHMGIPLLLKLVRELPRVACIKEEAVPTASKIRVLRAGMESREVPVLGGLGALYGLFDLEAGSSGFNTGFAFPEVLQALVAAARGGQWTRAREIYTRFLPLIVFEQQPGVAVRKEILRLRGVLGNGRVRHPGGSLAAATASQLVDLLEAVLPGVDLTQPLSL